MTNLSLTASFVAVLALSLSGCRSAPEKRPEDQLFEARQEYRQILDGLYRAYGGTDIPGNPTSGSTPQQDGGTIGHVISEADRSYFERQCLAIGRGERPFSVSAKMQRFLDGADNARGCRKGAELQVRIRKLEAEVGKP